MTDPRDTYSLDHSFRLVRSADNPGDTYWERLPSDPQPRLYTIHDHEINIRILIHSPTNIILEHFVNMSGVKGYGLLKLKESLKYLIGRERISINATIQLRPYDYKRIGGDVEKLQRYYKSLSFKVTEEFEVNRESYVYMETTVEKLLVS